MISVLIIDNEPRFREIVAEHLSESSQIKFNESRSVDEALDLLKGGGFDVIVANIHLHEVSGAVLLDLLKGRGVNVPVIFYGQNLNSSMIAEAVRHGAEFVLPLGKQPRIQFMELRSLVEEIVRRRQAEVALKRTVEDLRTIVTRNADAMVVLNQDGYIQYANPSAESLFNLSEHELIGKLFGFPIILEEPVEMYVLREFRKFVAVEMRMVEIEWRHQPSYLVSIRDVTWHVEHEEELAQSKNRLEAEVQDRSYDLAEAYESLRIEVKERKRAELALRESERKYRNIVELANEGILVIDKNSTIQFANHRIAEMLNRSTEGLVGKSIYNFVEQGQVTEQKLYFERRKQGIKESYDIELVRKDGSKALVMVNAAPFYDDDGFYAGSVAMYTDITDRKMSEKQLNEAKTQADLYLDLLSHDIRNLAQIALGYIELAIESDNLEETKELLVKPRETMEDAARIIDNVRKLQTTKKVLEELEPVDICDILSALKDLYSSTEGRQVDITMDASPDCVAMANELVNDVFTNLITNSIKHSDPEKPLEITLRVDRVRETGQDYLMISIEDNGPGIPDRFKDKLFVRFQRGDTKAHGKGLGLYLAKTLIESFGGKIWVEDRIPGEYTKGVRFVIVLLSAKSKTTPSSAHAIEP
ncbi:MAG TPA: PAS domain S-box protein [Methanocella sp.]|nr:PAS domain S-box protein [Methanocella sp.]